MKPNMPIVYRNLHNERRFGVVLHGVPGKPKRRVVRVRARKYIVVEIQGDLVKEVAQ